MLLTTQRAQLQLADDQVARLRDAFDSRLEVTEGFVWVTVDGERGDVVLAAGDSWVVDTAGEVTVSALRGSATIGVLAGVGGPGGAVARRPARGLGRLRQTLARFALSSEAVT